jgi:hypothetical protein
MARKCESHTSVLGNQPQRSIPAKRTTVASLPVLEYLPSRYQKCHAAFEASKNVTGCWLFKCQLFFVTKYAATGDMPMDDQRD